MALYPSSAQCPVYGASNRDVYSLLPQRFPTLQLGQNILGDQEIEAIMAVLPEVHHLENVLDQFYYKLHDDRKLSQFSTFFSQILADNRAVFTSLSIQHKAQILFDKYRELTLSELLKSSDYQAAYQPLQQKIGEWIDNSTLTEKIYKIYFSRAHLLHSCFVAFAVADPLQSRPGLISLSPDYQPRDLILPDTQISLLNALY